MGQQAGGPATLSTPGGAAEPARAAGLSPEGLAVLAPGQSAEQLLDALTAAGLLEDAVKLLARALPRREAVWWAARSAADAPRPPADGPPSAEAGRQHEAAVAAEAAARAAAEAWCADPADARRRAAHPAAEPVADTPSGLAALAAFLAEGSLAPADCPPVPPPPDSCPGLVAAAVLLAAVRTEPEKAADKRKQFLDVGRAVAAGTDRWPDAPAARPEPPAATGRPPAPPKPPPPPAGRRSYY